MEECICVCDAPPVCADANLSCATGELCMGVPVFLFCVCLAAITSGLIVAHLELLVSFFESRAPSLGRGPLRRVRLLGFNRVTTSELALNDRGEVGAAWRSFYDKNRSKEPNQIPPRVIRGCCGNRVEAQRLWAETLAWRDENTVNGILNEPQALFHVMKQYFPSFIYGRGKKGEVVTYERLGGLNVRKMEENGCTLPSLRRHYVFISEFVWRVLEPDEDAQIICVEDLRGVSFRDVTPKALDFIRSAAKTARLHYTERCAKLFIVNAPPWFGLVWNVLAPFLDARTKRKVRVLGSDLSELLHYIDASQLPAEYGGLCRTPLQDSPEERRLFMLVRTVNREFLRSSSLGGGGPVREAAQTRRSSGSSDASSRSPAVLAAAPPGEDQDCFEDGADVGLEIACESAFGSQNALAMAMRTPLSPITPSPVFDGDAEEAVAGSFPPATAFGLTADHGLGLAHGVSGLGIVARGNVHCLEEQQQQQAQQQLQLQQRQLQQQLQEGVAPIAPQLVDLHAGSDRWRADTESSSRSGSSSSTSSSSSGSSGSGEESLCTDGSMSSDDQPGRVGML